MGVLASFACQCHVNPNNKFSKHLFGIIVCWFKWISFKVFTERLGHAGSLSFGFKPHYKALWHIKLDSAMASTCAPPVLVNKPCKEWFREEYLSKSLPGWSKKLYRETSHTASRGIQLLFFESQKGTKIKWGERYGGLGAGLNRRTDFTDTQTTLSTPPHTTTQQRISYTTSGVLN